MVRSKKATLKRKLAGKKTKTEKAAKAQSLKKSTKGAGKSRAEGIRLFNLAGRAPRNVFHIRASSRNTRRRPSESHGIVVYCGAILPP